MGGASKFLMLLSTPFPFLYPRPSALRLARHSRVSLASLSIAASAAQNSVSPSSRPRLGFSVRAAEQIHTQTSIKEDYGEPLGSLPNSRALSHPWPEWLKLVEHLNAGGYADRRVSSVLGDDDDSFSVFEELPEEFVKAAEVCLLFARERPDLLRLLSRKEVEIVVENGSPFLFKNAMNSTRRMRSFVGSTGSNVMESERAHTVDMMRYLLSYACNPLLASGASIPKTKELVEVSVRNLLSELVNVSTTFRESQLPESMPRQSAFGYEQSSRPPRQNIEMKRGDWICTKCNFINFARNMNCLQCNEGRPKRQLTGAEWECPQCDFFNYGRNMACLRCDCKRPGEIPSNSLPGATLGYNGKSSIEQVFSRSNTDKSEMERRLATNDEKAERWFNKMSQLDSSSDLSSAIADEDFPEIMPLRKGVNKFVVSTRKTPLERRLANDQYRRNVESEGSQEGNNSLSGDVGGISSDKTSDSPISRSLDRILGRSSAMSGTNDVSNNLSAAGETDTGIANRFRSLERKDSGYVPFVPLPADMFSKSQKLNTEEQKSFEKEDSSSVKSNELLNSDSGGFISGKSGDAFPSEIPKTPTESERGKESLASVVPDDDFPEIMPMRKGENRFVVSKKKDRSLTSPQYKRRLAMEQANSSNFVPFVPFPPDYFAKKDKQPEAGPSSEKAAGESSSSSVPEDIQNVPEKLEGTKAGGSNWGGTGNVSPPENPGIGRKSWNQEFSGRNLNESKLNADYGRGTSLAQQPNNAWSNYKGSSKTEFSQGGTVDGPSATGSLTQRAESPENTRESWNKGFSGKSLEGSAVQEPDPLDMSEEAKAQRWFRRVAQIKDISELSQIPDEDFPEIMPMRKGVNRFVVSKRKTPLERRLTSQQYRRNLPIVSSEPDKDAS